MLQGIRNKNIVILGAARSGLSAAALLKNAGNTVFVSDISDKGKTRARNQLKKMDIPFEFGRHSERVYQADMVVLSPGIPSTSEIVRSVAAQNIPVYSEIEVAGWFCRSNIIAVTGSNGKTTTTTALGRMLKSIYQNAFVAGNIGHPFSDYVLESEAGTWCAVEVSSFQLETIDRFHPQIAVILNLAPNHLDWYDTYEDYIQAKLRILKNLTPDDYIIFDGDDKELCDRLVDHTPRKFKFSVSGKHAESYIANDTIFLFNEEITNIRDIALFGPHNYKNLMAAGIAAKIAGVSVADIAAVMRSFKGVPHRLEFVNQINGTKFINDSKATTLESLEAALNSFHQPVILLAGGKDKGADFDRIRSLVAKKVKHAILIGAAAGRISASWEGLIPITRCDGLDTAVRTALDIASPTDIVLLSPACSSFDMFKDFEDRGKIFKKIVNQVKRKYENQ